MNKGHARKLPAVSQTADGERASDRQDLLALRGGGKLRICAWCRRVPLRPDCWVEAEAVLHALKSVSKEMIAQATHGVCPDCFDAFLAGKHTAGALAAGSHVSHFASASA